MSKIYIICKCYHKKRKNIYIYVHVVKSVLILNMAFNNCNAFVSAVFDHRIS